MALFVLLVIFANGFVAVLLLTSAYKIPSEAMAPAVGPGDRILVWTIDTDVARGDVVVFECEEAGTCIKRVVAVGGDTVEAAEGRLIVNGEIVEEPYLAPATQTWDFPAVDVQDGEMFLLGDNRNMSGDSRFYGPVPTSRVVGTLAMVNVPLDWVLLGLTVLAGLVGPC